MLVNRQGYDVYYFMCIFFHFWVCRPVYYYEVKILDGGEHSYIGVGLSGKNCNLNGLPGWKRSSYGYHGDDGRIFEYSSIGRGRKYGEKFGTNDIIGTYSNQYFAF